MARLYIEMYDGVRNYFESCLDVISKCYTDEFSYIPFVLSAFIQIVFF